MCYTAFSDLLFMRGIQSESIRIRIVFSQKKVGSKSEEIKKKSSLRHMMNLGPTTTKVIIVNKKLKLCVLTELSELEQGNRQNIFTFNLCQFGRIFQHNQPEEIWDVYRTVAQPASQTVVVILKSHLPFNIVPIRSWEWHWCAAHRVYSCC